MSGAVRTGTRLSLELWHPNCWAIEATERTDGGILAHAVYSAPRAPSETVSGLFTAFGETRAEIEALLTAVRESDRSGDVLELQERFGRARDVPGDVFCEFMLEYDPTDMMCPTMLRHGFVHSAPVRIEDGSEEWQVCFTGDRGEMTAALDDVREDTGADITVAAVTTAPEGDDRTERARRLDSLTPAQREVFDLAREEGYYEWPRGCSTRELAERAGISKTTLLEHLRKAEAKLLDP